MQKPVFTAERPWFLIYCLLINNLTDLEQWNPELSLGVNLRSEAVLAALSLFLASLAVIVHLFSRCFSHVSMEFSAEHSKKSLDFAPADDNASSGESGTLERASLSSSPFSEKLGDDDQVARFDVKEILRRKPQGKAKKQKSMLAEVDLLKKLHSELSFMDFSREILNLTTKHSPLPETEPSLPLIILRMYTHMLRKQDHFSLFV